MPETLFEKEKSITYEYLARIENIRVLTADERTAAGFSAHDLIWEIDTEVLSAVSGLIPILLHILIPLEFPNSFPRIYLAPDHYERFRWLPHIDGKRFICSHDPVKSRPNTDQPDQVLHQVLIRAKTILTDGLDGKNEEDYLIEFLAYWELHYSGDDKVLKNILYLPDGQSKEDNKLHALVLKYPLQGYNYVVHRDGPDASLFKTYLKSIYLSYQEAPVLFLQDYSVGDGPPYELTNMGLIDKLRELGALSDLKRFLNESGAGGIVFFKKVIDDRQFNLGYYLKVPSFSTKHRYRKLSNYEKLKEIAPNVLIERISPQDFDIKRLQMRTDGTHKSDRYHFAIVGLGSVGSHLFSNLEAIADPEFTLIDPDELHIENIGRHLLGFSYCGKSKVSAMAEYYRGKNPLHQVVCRQESVFKTLQHSADVLNTADQIFICVGNYNVEKFLVDSIRSGIITKPTYFLWVEPFMAAGHCLYIHGEDIRHYPFDDFGLFQFNLISHEEYLNETSNLTLNEAGCQSSFVPYSALQVKRFLSAISEVIYNNLNANIKKSKSFTWIGDLGAVRSNNIKLNSKMANEPPFCLITHE